MSAESPWGCGEVVFSAPTTAKVEFVANGPDLGVAVVEGGLELKPDTGLSSLTHVLSLRVPITVPDGRQVVGYLQDIIFGIRRTPDVRVLIVADLAGTVKVVEFDYENPTAPPLDDPMRKVRVFSPQGVESANNSGLGLSGPVADYVATLSITIQRRTPQGHGRIEIDTLDVSAILTQPTARKG